MILDSIRIHWFTKQIHVFTNLLYDSRNLKNNVWPGHHTKKKEKKKKFTQVKKNKLILPPS
jgi:hypothetical protein